MTNHLHWPIVVIILIQSVFLYPLVNPGLFVSHDGENHVARFAAYYKAFSDKNIPPRWAGDLNYKYGSPVLNFFYPLPGYLASLVRVLNLSFQNIFKMLIGLAFIAAPVTCYLWLHNRLPRGVSFVGSLLYGLAPYHFLNLYVRGDIAEMTAFVFIPLVFLLIEKRSIALGGIFYALLILSHNGISLMFTPVFLGYIFFLAKNNIGQLKNLLILVVGLSLSAYFWLPALVELRYTMGDVFIGQMYKEHFPTITQLVYSPWGFGANVAKSGGLSPQLGPFLVVLVLFGILVFFRSKKKNAIVAFWLIVFATSVFLSLPISTPIWEHIWLLPKFQFPWRFSGLTTLASVAIVSYSLSSIKNQQILTVIALFTVGLGLPFIKVDRYIDYKDSYYLSFPATTYYHGEATTIWSQGEASAFPNKPVEVIAGTANVTDIKRTTVRHIFSVVASTKTDILDNTFYYPGWRIEVDGHSIPIQFQDPNHRGLITFSLPEGTHHVAVSFGETPLRKMANIISLLTIAAIGSIWFFRRKGSKLGFTV